MPRFPKKEPDIYALAQAMIAGYKMNPTVFPRADVPALEAAYAAYQETKRLQISWEAVAKVATDYKDTALENLETFMKQQLTRSEVDTADNPKALGLIWWGTKSAPEGLTAPGMPRNLTCVREGKGTLELDWKPPAPGAGGPVRTYVILRRDKPGPGQPFSTWAECQSALATETFLMNQPRGIDLEYKVVAVNAAGTSTPSNTAACVL